MTARAKHQSAYKVFAGEGEMLHAPPLEWTREPPGVSFLLLRQVAPPNRKSTRLHSRPSVVIPMQAGSRRSASDARIHSAPLPRQIERNRVCADS